MSPSLLILKIFPTPPSNAYVDPPPRLLFKIFFYLRVPKMTISI